MSNNVRSRVLLSLVSVALPLGSAACHGPCHDMTARELQESHMDRAKANYGRHLNDMADNAILQDMSLADFHFVAHTSEISGTGAERLNRMARLLNTYGGTINYQTDLADTTLVNKRIEHVKEYLTVAGCDMDKVQVKTGLAAGHTTPARKAIEVEAKGTANPKESAGASTGFAAPMMPSGK